ncbi:lytic murein transglycosylase [Afifella sp. IM 167]|uniref:lytic murein transglycosylase n=1 Tax=Afifella sp. IM 167 TaxID=2033586 RepID=UPI001CCEB38B|nr:lytic murein transglycosylase [Afifella sp. IM 167]MBZ8132822.1 lytic transglycosylase [Afifella sp. IM 167]
MRTAIFGGHKVAIALALCAGLALPAPALAASFSACVDTLTRQVVAEGVSRRVAERALGAARYDEEVMRKARAQPEFKTPIWDYMGFLVDEQRIADGQTMMRRYDRVLREAERRFGVNRYVIAAIWGVESNYGQDAGDDFLPHALANLVCGGVRAKFFRGELVAALELVDRGDLELEELYGSWAGAFGQTQFIPSTYRRLAVDGDGDGKRDLVKSAADALASTANYLDKAGWRKGESWLIEVKAPDSYKGPTGRGRKASLSTWAKRGIVRADGAHLAGGAQAGLLLPSGPKGPGFLVFRNFDAIYSYNQAESYALAISHLADRLAGYPGLRTAWPTDDPPLSRAQRFQLQRLLLAKGYDVGEADGKIGPQSRAAIEAAEKRFGMPPTGRPGGKIYRALGGR